MLPVLFLFFAFVSGIVLVLDKRKARRAPKKKKKTKNNPQIANVS